MPDGLAERIERLTVRLLSLPPNVLDELLRTLKAHASAGNHLTAEQIESLMFEVSRMQKEAIDELVRAKNELHAPEEHYDLRHAIERSLTSERRSMRPTSTTPPVRADAAQSGDISGFVVVAFVLVAISLAGIVAWQQWGVSRPMAVEHPRYLTSLEVIQANEAAARKQREELERVEKGLRLPAGNSAVAIYVIGASKAAAALQDGQLALGNYRVFTVGRQDALERAAEDADEMREQLDRATSALAGMTSSDSVALELKRCVASVPLSVYEGPVDDLGLRLPPADVFTQMAREPSDPSAVADAIGHYFDARRAAVAGLVACAKHVRHADAIEDLGRLRGGPT